MDKIVYTQEKMDAVKTQVQKLEKSWQSWKQSSLEDTLPWMDIW